ncbi:zinc finger protein ubi-d4 isoform X4 [Dendroctonus ponderosae]|uniref:PHD-type domain-containing protein n=1 Tax=Dendroctonus ponderosae TaxID=77166 RepID=A0AAR5PGS7_DENPD|nr:zinc finger protein ubi-d4 isoform X4 [Dendroctonus ponderosae]
MATVTTIPAPPEIKPPTNNALSNLEKIENFINEPIYKEILENAVNFNTRLCIERRLRLPFIDTQTGVAQNHSSLFMAKRQRLPGLNPGQIYSYPRQRWRKKRRQYLTMNARAYARHVELLDGETDMHSISQIENPALQDTDSKDSQLLPGEVSKEWFYDEQDMLEMETFDEPDPDSDLDYEESYTKRRRGRKGTGRVMYNSAGRSGADTPSTPGRKRGAGRGRGKKTGPGGHNYDPTPGDPDKPFACERTPRRSGSRQPGAPPAGPLIPQPPLPPHPLTGPNQAPPTLPPNLPAQPLTNPMGDDPPMPILQPEKVIEIPLVNVMPPQEPIAPGPSILPPMVADRKVPPSPYCDFCLGDSTQNKKTGGVEELVSCHDCGRSGHPTCLQFTDNMKVSVKKYRWQCIECKCCSVCGTSDNDDQLLFCDDCDRGYHMYCLSPPLVNPPEGSWSCQLCIKQFHQK